MSDFSFKNSDFVLKVNADQNLTDKIEKYEAFLSALCGEEYYFQKEAIYEVLKYFFSEQYNNLWDLAKENYTENEKLSQRFESQEKYKEHLQLPNQKSCSIDLATGTGKSFVIYGIAQIMLAEGLVDQVLVLCPSLTIEDGLKEKFVALSGNKILKKLLPKGSVVSNPRIINATRTIKKGDICIENIHAVYKNTGSSIYDSLKGKGQKTLVLNDEAHHIFNKVSGTGDDSAFKEWKKFLLNSDYGFNYIVNLSGTPYIDQDYFTDIVYRYALKDGMEQKVIKSVEYLIETGDEKKMKGFQEIWKNHEDNKKKYKEIKPISIVITSDIAKCVEVWNDLVKFIADKEKISIEKAKKKAIWVVSGIPSKSSSGGKKIFQLVEKPESERNKNLLLLKEVDDPNNPVEWILSVAMLTEGWDVKNVFQIVPHESKAFNSKLLIAQVLGRGLRIPEIYKGKDDIRVRVYNHIKFSAHIKNLVDEVLEIEDRFSWFPVSSQSTFNFSLHNLNYIKDLEFKQEKRKQVEFSEKINLGPQSKKVEDYNIYKDVLTGEEIVSKYNIETVAFTLDAAANDIWSLLASHDLEEETNFRIKYPKSKIKKIIQNNLPEDSKDFISYENLNKAKTAFGKLFDVGGIFPYFKERADQLQKLNTSEITKQSVSATSLKRESMCFYSTDTINSLDGDEKATFREILDNEEEYKIKEKDLTELKTPLNCLCVSHEPERKFAKILFQNVELFDSFVKNPDKSFYSIPYSFKKGTHMKYLNFHPDFFLKKESDILVVEIKKDEDDSRENIAKNRDALKHFETINKLQNELCYYFFFLSPEDYVEFFQAIREQRYKDWRSRLINILENN
jgi:type III restriction enzyme